MGREKQQAKPTQDVPFLLIFCIFVLIALFDRFTRLSLSFRLSL